MTVLPTIPRHLQDFQMVLGWFMGGLAVLTTLMPIHQAQSQRLTPHYSKKTHQPTHQAYPPKHIAT